MALTISEEQELNTVMVMVMSADMEVWPWRSRENSYLATHKELQSTLR